jgi:hypothetical protein
MCALIYGQVLAKYWPSTGQVYWPAIASSTPVVHCGSAVLKAAAAYKQNMDTLRLPPIVDFQACMPPSIMAAVPLSIMAAVPLSIMAAVPPIHHGCRAPIHDAC